MFKIKYNNKINLLCLPCNLTDINFYFSLKMIESNVIKLLEGVFIDDNEELCDFTLANQNEVIGIDQFYFVNIFILIVKFLSFYIRF